MPKEVYKIPVEWTMIDTLEIEADSLEEAKEKAYRMTLTKGQYVDDSFQINEEVLEALYSGED